MARNLMFPSLYYFSLECFSAACLAVLMKAFTGQRPCPLQRQADRKRAERSTSHLPFSCVDCRRGSVVSAASSKSLQSLVRWRKIYELRGSSNKAQLPVSEPRLCQTEESGCPPTHSPTHPLTRSPALLHVQALAKLISTEWLS